MNAPEPSVRPSSASPAWPARLAGVPTRIPQPPAAFANTVPPYPGGPGTAPPIAGEPNPGLAALLGFIPGVGAMYNGQYAKGVVHLIVFAILVSLANNVNGIFGLFIAGWVFYQVIEAHHTARPAATARRSPIPSASMTLANASASAERGRAPPRWLLRSHRPLTALARPRLPTRRLPTRLRRRLTRPR